jgi:hypothetical protein
MLPVLDFLERLWSRARRSLLIIGGIGASIALVAAYVAVATLFAPPHSSDTGNRASGDEVVQTGEVPPSPPRFSASDYRQSSFPPSRRPRRPLIGVNYTHYAFPNCTFHRTYIPASYHRPGVAQKVHNQLSGMRKAGVDTIRTVLWHDATGQDWGPIPSAGGALREPFRTNLIRYVTEVKRFGFARLTIAFHPERTHNPLRRAYTPDKFAQNWRFIREVRSVVKRHGPRNTRFDLFSEGAPNETPTRYEPVPAQTGQYISRLYRLYVKRYGNRDVTVSAVGSFTAAEETNRLENLIRILRSSGAPLPRWYDLHIGYDPTEAAHALRQAEAVLNRNRQHQPLVIGDLGYDNPQIARAIKRVLRRSARPLEEVSPWYTRVRFGCQVTPPYAPGVYGRELQSR